MSKFLVLRFSDVPINNSVRMEVLQRQEHFGGVKFCLPQRELLALNVQHQITSTHVFHHKVDAGLSLEARMQTKQERMPFSGSGQEHAFLRSRTIAQQALSVESPLD